MLQAFIRLLLSILLIITWSISSTAQDNISPSCGILDSINYKYAHDLSEKEYLRAAACISKVDKEKVESSIDSLTYLMGKLAYYNQIELLKEVTTILRPYATKKVNKYKILRTEADLSRKLQQWRTADSLYDESAKYATTEYEKVASLLFSGYCASVNYDDERGREQYEKGMYALKSPELLDDEDNYFVYNLSATINTMLGSQNIAAKNYLSLFSNGNLKADLRARAATNILALYSGNEKCDSVRMFAHFARINLDKSSSRTNVYWQLIKCDGIEGMLDSAEIHFDPISNFETDQDKFLKPFILSDYYAATNQGDKILPLIEVFARKNPKDITNIQYLRGNYVRSIMNNRNKSADYHIEKYLMVRDSVYGENMKKNVSESQVAMDLKMSEAESKALSQDLIFSTQTSKLRSTIAWTLGLGLLISCFLLFKVIRQRKKLNKSHEEISTLNRELNHRAANQISLAYELILDQRRQIGDEQAKASLQKSESQLMALREVNRALANKSDDLVQADQVLQKVAENLQSASPYPFKLDLQLDAITIHGNAASRSALILSELMSNSIKYAFPNQEDARATLSLKQSDRGISMTYVDNGPGKDGRTRGTGVGSELIEAMLEDMDAEFEEIVGEDGTGYGLRWWWG